MKLWKKEAFTLETANISPYLQHEQKFCLLSCGLCKEVKQIKNKFHPHVSTIMQLPLKKSKAPEIQNPTAETKTSKSESRKSH